MKKGMVPMAELVKKFDNSQGTIPLGFCFPNYGCRSRNGEHNFTPMNIDMYDKETSEKIDPLTIHVCVRCMARWICMCGEKCSIPKRLKKIEKMDPHERGIDFAYMARFDASLPPRIPTQKRTHSHEQGFSGVSYP
jgi:hypothetical protein